MISLLVSKSAPVSRLAADEFAKYWLRISGEKLPVVSEDPGGDLVVFGSDATNVFAHDMIVKGVVPDFPIRTGADDYALVSAKDGERNLLFLAPGRPRALFYAVYRFFELRANCRWFWDGDIVPKGPAPDITGLNITEKPRFEYRGLRYFAHRSLDRFQAEQWDIDDWKREIDWILKRRLNLFMLRIGLDDLFQLAFPDIVHYPKGYECPEAMPRSYNDRTLFWSMEYRHELRKTVLAYARERDLLHPEDFGTPTHWYSRTPYEYLKAVKPAFLSQSNNNYAEDTGFVWDIRDDKNLDAYFKLLETHIKEYGSPDIFHTIGTGERRFYPDHLRNHEMKRYVYRRILSKLREKYPNAPVLIGSWDFVSTWSHDEVREFVSELDPSNTLILDYTSDIDNELNNFRNWGVVRKFPWIFGIFHAFEASNEIRGNYDNIRNRFPEAVEDPMCKGVVFWPENSHQDTLMLDYFSTIGWDPSQYKIEKFLPGFCRRRYGEEKALVMEPIWQKLLPLAMASRWGTWAPHSPMREVYPDTYFLQPGWFFGTMDEPRLEYFRFEAEQFYPLLPYAIDVFEALAKLDFAALDDFARRDFLDIARTAAARMLEYGLSRVGSLLDGWTRGDTAIYYGFYDNPVMADEVRGALDDMRKLGGLFSDLLEASGEFSLKVSLDELKRKHETNPDFEKTLKGNAENGYCRSHIYELSRYIYEPGFDAMARYIEARLNAGDHRPWIGLDQELEGLKENPRDAFYDKPLAEMAPDVAKARARLPETLREMAKIVSAWRARYR